MTAFIPGRSNGHMPLVRLRSVHSGRPVSFSAWTAALAASRLPVDQRGRFATEIRRFLKYCHILNAPVSWSQAREYLAIVPLLSARPDARAALRWFFRAARHARDHRPRDSRRQLWPAGWIPDQSPSLASSAPGGPGRPRSAPAFAPERGLVFEPDCP